MSRTNRSIFFALVFTMLICHAAFGDYVIQNGRITGVNNVINNDQYGFIVYATCSGTNYTVQFHRDDFVNDQSFQRSYANAILGFSLGCRVTIYEYSAGHPTYISLSLD